MQQFGYAQFSRPCCGRTENPGLCRLEKKLAKLGKFQKRIDLLKNEKESINRTDVDAGIMKHKDRRIVPGYNHQSAIDDKYGVTVSVETTQSNDSGEDLFSIVDKAKKATGQSHEHVPADCGFADYESLKKMETEREETFLVPDRLFEGSKKEDGEKIKQGDFNKIDGEYFCPAGKKMEHKRDIEREDGSVGQIYECSECKGCAIKEHCTKGEKRTITIDSGEVYREKMRERLKTNEGRERYMKRQWLTECGHGNDQKNKGWKQHFLRGLEKAKLEFILIRIGSNLGKMIKHRAREVLQMA